jgi:hypothetical protein
MYIYLKKIPKFWSNPIVGNLLKHLILALTIFNIAFWIYTTNDKNEVGCIYVIKIFIALLGLIHIAWMFWLDFEISMIRNRQ